MCRFVCFFLGCIDRFRCELNLCRCMSNDSLRNVCSLLFGENSMLLRRQAFPFLPHPELLRCGPCVPCGYSCCLRGHAWNLTSSSDLHGYIARGNGRSFPVDSGVYYALFREGNDCLTVDRSLLFSQDGAVVAYYSTDPESNYPLAWGAGIPNVDAGLVQIYAQWREYFTYTIQSDYERCHGKPIRPINAPRIFTEISGILLHSDGARQIGQRSMTLGQSRTSLLERFCMPFVMTFLVTRRSPCAKRRYRFPAVLGRGELLTFWRRIDIPSTRVQNHRLEYVAGRFRNGLCAGSNDSHSWPADAAICPVGTSAGCDCSDSGVYAGGVGSVGRTMCSCTL